LHWRASIAATNQFPICRPPLWRLFALASFQWPIANGKWPINGKPQLVSGGSIAPRPHLWARELGELGELEELGEEVTLLDGRRAHVAELPVCVHKARSADAQETRNEQAMSKQQTSRPRPKGGRQLRVTQGSPVRA